MGLPADTSSSCLHVTYNSVHYAGQHVNTLDVSEDMIRFKIELITFTCACGLYLVRSGLTVTDSAGFPT